MTLKIISTEDILFEGEVESVTLPGVMGAFTVLRNHASLISILTAGKISYHDEDGEDKILNIEGGLVDVDNNIISVCVY